MTPTVATIDLAAIAHNYRALAAAVAPARVLAIVKAHAYGHGTIRVAESLVAAGAWGLGVTTPEEAFALRDAGIRARVVVLGGAYEGACSELVARDIEVAIGRREDVDALCAAARSFGRPVHLHAKVDTGMARLGTRPAGLHSLLETIAKPEAELVGFMTHLSAADEADLANARAQLRRFEECLRATRAAGFKPHLAHVANTAGALRMPEARYDLVRFGIGLYGARPSENVPDVGLQPALSVTTRVIALRDLERGDTVGYGSRWRASQRSHIATLPVGYGDGYLRRLSNRAQVLVSGRRVPVVGSISMDLMMVDVTGLSVSVGDEVVLLGKQGGAHIRVEEVAAWAETIPYEILVGLARRIPRQYVGHD